MDYYELIEDTNLICCHNCYEKAENKEEWRVAGSTDTLIARQAEKGMLECEECCEFLVEAPQVTMAEVRSFAHWLISVADERQILNLLNGWDAELEHARREAWRYGGEPSLEVRLGTRSGNPEIYTF